LRAGVETSIGRVYLFDGWALKLKRPVDFGFVDFTALERRGWALRRELELNRATAPTFTGPCTPSPARQTGP
jgi:aminoglycoside phosphotransferase family enzyme